MRFSLISNCVTILTRNFKWKLTLNSIILLKNFCLFVFRSVPTKEPYPFCVDLSLLFFSSQLRKDLVKIDAKAGEYEKMTAYTVYAYECNSTVSFFSNFLNQGAVLSINLNKIQAKLPSLPALKVKKHAKGV